MMLHAHPAATSLLFAATATTAWAQQLAQGLWDTRAGGDAGASRWPGRWLGADCGTVAPVQR